ncbi:hypothetical protein BCV70DRAFT_177019 [Testicularia cyperi]|uniref:Uncharacterized protein n=1 Tax=Testicularia cyperi TaxID=1882483 RepID=A0A317XLW6_9BASI|nr:hypothetical protein BCV70DRAFT_177019 [Testicularia cyperi]
MDSRMLNVAAPVFQPGGSGVGGGGGGANGGNSGSFVPPHMLSQIQNQMVPVAHSPGGMMHMNAQSRPFVPGGNGAQGNFKPQSPSPNFQPAAAVPIINTPVPPRLGHGMNAGSVHLTGLATFLGTPVANNNLPSPGPFVGPPSPLTPHAQPASPFGLPTTTQPGLGLGPGRMMHGSANPVNGKLRKNKGPPPVTPLKTTGHNSTPSISMNPAAFAASLAAAKAKRRVVIAVPSEGPIPDDVETLAHESAQETDDEPAIENGAEPDADLAEEKRQEKVRRRLTREAALTRLRWTRRVPLSHEEHLDPTQVQEIDMPSEATVTCAIHPEPWPVSMGLPDTIDIYLPGMSAWDEYLEMREEEKMAIAATAEAAASVAVPEPRRALPSFLLRDDSRLNNTIKGQGQGRSLSISHPADPDMVSFKLSRYLESQRAAQQGVTHLPIREEANEDDDAPASAKSFSRFQSDLPPRLREAFAKRQSEGISAKARFGSGHGHTMSLGLPSSGGPFAPEVFSALDMIRANSDEGSAEPVSGKRPEQVKTLSDTDASPRRAGAILTEIKEAAEADENEVEAKNKLQDEPGSPNANGQGWQDLGRGFGYEVGPDEMEAVESEPLRKHVRQASRISVSTSRKGGDDEDNDDTTARRAHEDVLELDFAEDEIRTNPSEDADASDFEEEIDEVAVQRNWSARRSSTHLNAFNDQKVGAFYGDESDYLDDDDGDDDGYDEDLRDSLTPSNEEFSNPSDEEAAREERILRRQHRAALREARRNSRLRQRPRANTNNTLPSSSIGEADIYDHRAHLSHAWAFPQRAVPAKLSHPTAEIISNPSDEVDSDLDETNTFGAGDDAENARGAPRLSQDFRFPPPGPSHVSASTNIPTNDKGFSRAPATSSGTLGRASGFSLLNPGAKEFKFGGGGGIGKNDGAAHLGSSPSKAAARSVSAPQQPTATDGSNQALHFRLPSIKNSSFGSSALGEVAGAAGNAHLNVAAPAFKPGAFTFTAPDGARLAVPVESKERDVSAPLHHSSDGPVDVDGELEGRESQGREKRQRYGPIDYSGDEALHIDEYPPSPPRPRASAASIEGPLRSFSSFARNGPPPFNANGSQIHPRAVSAESKFTPHAPSFVPTWAKGTGPGNGGTFRRLGLPDFGGEAATNGAAPTPFAPSGLPASISDPSVFAFEARNKAIPIRRPDEPAKKTSPEPETKKQKTADGLDPHRQAGDLAGTGQLHSSAISSRPSLPKEIENQGYSQSPPVPIPTTAASHSHSTARSFGSEVGRYITLRSRSGHTPSLSRDSLDLSLDSRARRPGSRSGAGNHHHHHHHHLHGGHNGHGAHLHHTHCDSDDESLSDFIEELAERVDKVLEGWAGKILDEVTIMGQVRPHPKAPGVTDAQSSSVEAMVGEISKRMESYLETYIVGAIAEHARKPSADASDETQTTIRPARLGNDSSDDKLGTHGFNDAAGEWDFDYVQESLEAKMQLLQERLETTFTQAIDRLSNARQNVDSSPRGDADGVEAPTLPQDLVEKVSSQVVTKIGSMLQDQIASLRATDHEEQAELSVKLQSTLEKHASDRNVLEALLQAHQKSLNHSLAEVSDGLGETVSLSVLDSLKPYLQGLSSTAMHPDMVAARVTEILAPLISDAHESQIEERRLSQDQYRAQFPTSDEFADETLRRIEPVVASLKSDPIDSDALVARIGEVIGKQSIEHMVDLSPVIALLEPLIEKQEDVRSTSRKIIQQQQEVERTLTELPGAINAKTEIFLSTAAQTSERQSTILERLSDLQEHVQRSIAQQTAADEQGQKERGAQLQALRNGNDKLITQLEQARAEIAAKNEAIVSIREEASERSAELSAVTSKNAELQSKVDELQAELLRQSGKAADDSEKASEAERLLVEARAAQNSVEKEARILRDHVEQLSNELIEARADRARERETSAQATAEALARAERAEKAAREAQTRADDLVERSYVAEREAHALVQSTADRAGKADGQIQALEKRITEQDAKIANLINVTATQKQKAATSQQKLAEVEKRAKELELQAKQLVEARAQVQALEVKVKEGEDLGVRLAASEEREERARAEIRTYEVRFNDLEKDLLSMREQFVERSAHEATQKELDASRREIEALKAALAEQASQAEASRGEGWEEVPRPARAAPEKVGAWASMHAPKVNGSGPARTASKAWSHSGELMGIRSLSFASSVRSRDRDVEVDEGGWWS